MKEVTFPERVMFELGIETLFVSNASGGMNPKFQIGDLMVIDDHINFFPAHPLRGKNLQELGSPPTSLTSYIARVSMETEGETQTWTKRRTVETEKKRKRGRDRNK